MENIQKLEESFSEHTQKIIAFAKNTAQKSGADLIGTEYLLAGLLDLQDEVLSKIFGKLGIDITNVKEYVKYNVSGTQKPTTKEPDFSPRTKRVFDIAQEERLTLNHRYIEGEHLLLGIIKEGEGMGYQILKKFGVVYDNVLAAIKGIVGEGSKEDGVNQISTPLLDKFGENFNNRAREGKLDPVIGRSEEIERVLQILSRRRKNNPVLIGEPGVGKTAIVEGLAYRMVTGDIPDMLKRKRVIGLSLMSLMAGASKRGEFEERLQNVLKEAKSTNGEVILFFDEIHTLISSDASTDTANILKPVLARGEIQFIGATTTAEYHRYIEKDQALERRFQPVVVAEPNEEDTLEILKGIRDKYEAFHRVVISDEILKEAITLSSRYIFDRFQPDKSIDLIDESAAATRLPSFSAPKKVQELENKISKLEKELETAKRNNMTEDMEKLETSLTDEKKKLEEMKESLTQEKAKQHDTISKDTLAEIISKSTGIPVYHMKGSESERLLKMEDYLHKRLIGQNEAVRLVSEAIRRGRAGLKKANKPIGSFLFMGPTGVGKTELAKTVAEYLFGTEESMIRFDMSEYMEKHSYFRLIGAPPGYVGYEEGGQLTEAVRKKPFCVILFDEIEKAHKDIFNLLLQILDDGRLTDSKGHVVNFKNAIIICTSNVGSTKIQQKLFEYEQNHAEQKAQTIPLEKQTTDNLESTETDSFNNNPDNLPAVVDEEITALNTKIEKQNNIVETPRRGVSTGDDDTIKQMLLKQLKAELIEDLKEFLRPELINRFDDIVVFEPLTKEYIIRIVDVMMQETIDNLKEKDMLMVLTQEAKNKLGDLGYDPIFGARPLKRVIQQEIDTPLADMILEGSFRDGDKILCDVKENIFTFEKVESFSGNGQVSQDEAVDTRIAKEEEVVSQG